MRSTAEAATPNAEWPMQQAPAKTALATTIATRATNSTKTPIHVNPSKSANQANLTATTTVHCAATAQAHVISANATILCAIPSWNAAIQMHVQPAVVSITCVWLKASAVQISIADPMRIIMKIAVNQMISITAVYTGMHATSKMPITHASAANVHLSARVVIGK